MNCFHDIIYRMAFEITDQLMLDHELDPPCSDDVDREWVHLRHRLGYSAHDSGFLRWVKNTIHEELPWLEETMEHYDVYDEEFKVKGENVRDQDSKAIREKAEILLTDLVEKVRKWMLDTINVNSSQSENRDIEKTIITEEYVKQIVLTLIEKGQQAVFHEELKTMDAKDAQMMIDYYRYHALHTYISEESDYLDHMNVIMECNQKLQSLNPEYILDWFKEEDIREFITLYFGPADTEEQHNIDKKLKQINDLMPETLGYYVFPDRWEENGLADIIRNNYDLDAETIYASL